MRTRNREKIAACKRFLNEYTPASLEAKLNNCVIGQSELVKAVADFLYYHVLRCVHPELPVRNLLIAGSSGSGKTEVFRCVREMFGRMINVTIADATRITKEGWSGNYKLLDILSPDVDILVFDEADKMCKPSFSNGGTNVSEEIQGELLKLLEGEYEVVDKRNSKKYKIENLSLVFIGAFENIRQEKKKKAETHQLGFGTQEKEPEKWNTEITDEELIGYGMMPEIVGRISIKVTTNDLTDEDYLAILQNSHGRVASLLRVLSSYGVNAENILNKEFVTELIEKSRKNRTGFRWVSAQVENRILETIRDGGILAAEDPNDIYDEEAEYALFDEEDWSAA